MKTTLAQAQIILPAAHPTLRGKYYTNASVTLNPGTAPAALFHVEFCTHSFL